MARPTKKAAPAKASKPVAAKKAAPVKAAPPAKAAPPVKAKAAVAPAKVPAATAAPKKVAPAGTIAKAPPPKKPVFNDKELATIREDLLVQRATMERELEDLDAGSFNISQSELSGEVSFDEEYADAGTFTFERERDFSLANNIRDLMDKIDLAIRKIDGGTYGLCERCGKPIDKNRLKALPYSVLCISCKKQEERFR